MRRRSLSSDRTSGSKSKGHQRRGDPRRQTQPVVRFGETTIAPSQAPMVKAESDEDNELPEPPPALPPGDSGNPRNPEDTKDNGNPKSPEDVKFVDESTSKETSSDEKLNEKTSEPSTSRTEAGLLWTDF